MLVVPLAGGCVADDLSTFSRISDSKSNTELRKRFADQTELGGNVEKMGSSARLKRKTSLVWPVPPLCLPVRPNDLALLATCNDRRLKLIRGQEM